ncbi:hypothetical protein [Plastoroseomonas arctica]|uniref:Uncharacterized protein n=1 Tax=Plastoroseomonas arctica TaxID=1509237 RepID=A0AAF1JV87_9PROT|nr:hypothetical protein [Plastoroseomonas arctica]MBR0654445.1 hypothetical protein [Plastoroseomonas arctica]
MQDAHSLATRAFLEWLEKAPRGYEETMAGWRSSCPRLALWEDALAEGFIRVEPEPGGMSTARVAVTEAGRNWLRG